MSKTAAEEIRLAIGCALPTEFGFLKLCARSKTSLG